MTPRTIRAWSLVHKWSSLVCTAFMLLLCITGLPLVFHHEIGHWLGTEAEPPALAGDAPEISLDEVMATALARHPGLGGMFVSKEPDDDRVWYVTLAPTPRSHEGLRQVAVDARTGEVLAEPSLDSGFLHLMRSLHIDLFLGLPGMLFLGFMGLLLLVAIVSGVVLYAPFMRRLRFGEVRRDRSRRARWLDLHNLVGIVTVVWLFVVGATGVFNTVADLLVQHWQDTELAEMVAPYRGMAPYESTGSLQAALDAARAREPDTKVRFIAFPGTSFSSPHHFGVFMRGDEPLTSRMSKPVLVDALTAEVTDSRDPPWYLAALMLSRPLHFGDYGGMPLQVIWAILDMLTILVLGSGLYLWLARGARREGAPEVAGQGAAAGGRFESAGGTLR